MKIHLNTTGGMFALCGAPALRAGNWTSNHNGATCLKCIRAHRKTHPEIMHWSKDQYSLTGCGLIKAHQNSTHCKEKVTCKECIEAINKEASTIHWLTPENRIACMAHGSPMPTCSTILSKVTCEKCLAAKPLGLLSKRRTCESCKHWAKRDKECIISANTNFGAKPNYCKGLVHLKTEPNFGCIHHQPK